MTRWLIAITAIAFASLCPASAAMWQVDHARSRLGFTVQWSGEPFAATFKTWSANIKFDPADLAHARAAVTIDLGSEASDFPDNDDGLKGVEGFSVSQFPTARFETTSFTAKGGNNYVATGRLTIHGVSRPVSLPFTLSLTGDIAHMNGRAVVMRTDFGLGRGEWSSASTIAHEVAISVDLTAVKVR
jgi:polyisoprenoid-binding protein YceI